MSTIKVTNIQNPNSGTNDIIIDASGNVDIGGFSADASAPVNSVNLDSSGRLLVGTSTWSVGATAAFVANSSSATGNADVHLSRGLAATGMSSGQDIAVISFSDNAGAKFAQIGAQVDATPGSGDYPGRLVFSTNPGSPATSPTERMSINSNGDTSIKTNGTERFLVNNNGVYLRTLSTTAAAANVNVWTASSPTNLLLRSTSSLKYKTQIETLEDVYSEKILSIRPVWFRSTSEADNPDHSHWGFIAEEVAEIDPRLCFFIENENGDPEPDGVQYDRFVPHLLNLIKRQKGQIEALEARLTAAGI